MLRLFTVLSACLLASAATAAEIKYPPDAKPAAIAAHKAVLAEVAARPRRAHDPFRVRCPYDARGLHFVSRDPDVNVRLALKRDCASGHGSGGAE